MSSLVELFIVNNVNLSHYHVSNTALQYAIELRYEVKTNGHIYFFVDQ